LTTSSRDWLTAPNLISFARLLLAPVVAWAICSGRSELALGLFALAAATDFLDGLLARSAGAATQVGQYLDPIADKALLCTVYVALGIARRVPLWFVCIVFGRDLALLIASAIAMRVSRYDNYRPTIWGKISTFWQIAAATAAIAVAGSRFTEIIILISAAATVWSAVHYTWRGVSFFVYRRAR
jgi:cardiolipin synthase